MRKLKVFVSGLIVGALLGLWGGVNIGKQQSIYANPFSDQPVADSLRDAGRSAARESGDALERGGKALREKATESE